MLEDAELLRRYAREKSDAAFAELVRRHLTLVYSVALRQVGGDAHLAEDVAQHVFLALARKAATLVDRPSLTGWLYRSTHFAASDLVRGERRRRARETEAQSMQSQNSPEPGGVSLAGEPVDWEKVRPAIDAAIAELDERDRDAVALRFFDGRTFAEVGLRLQLTENAARMRVERALDKLHAALARRGMTSTAAALGLALAHQASIGAPVGLAVSITGAAMAVTATGAAGFGATLGVTKLLAGLGAAATAVSVGVAVIQYQEKRDAEAARADADQRRRAVQSELEDATRRLASAERRATEADKDNLELLQAAQPLRDGRTVGRGQNVAVGGANPAAGEEDEGVVETRAYQQRLAARRAEEAKDKAALDLALAAEPAAEQRFHQLIAAAEQHWARAEFQLAIRVFNQAMQARPAGLELNDRVRQLQSALGAQNGAVEVTLVSDFNTWVSIVNARAPEKFGTTRVKLLPGDYQVIGRRKGYRDVRVSLQVRSGRALPPVTVICTVSAEGR